MFWAFWNDKRKTETHTKNDICNSNLDLRCWWPRIWSKIFFGCVVSKLKQKKKKNSTCYTKNMNRILKCSDRLRSDFHKLANLRLTTFGFWNPGFTTLNLKIIFRNCQQNNLTGPLFSVYCQHVASIDWPRPSPLLLA